MDASQAIVTVAGLIAALWVIWFFFIAEKKRTVALTTSTGIQEIEVRVKGGYDPAVIVVKRGKPVRLKFYREEQSSCSERVIFSDFSINQFLPAFKTTVIEFTPDKEGEFTFNCGMNMLRGKLVVES
jgi:plastocyanin domain-containing protein